MKGEGPLMTANADSDLLDRVRKLLAKADSAKAWRCSWMLGYCSAVVNRVRSAEEAAVSSATTAEGASAGQSTALVLADLSLVVRQQVTAEYPKPRRKRVTYSGSGYGDGYREGQKADIGVAKIGSRSAGELGR
jgi:hypothetical protein